MPFLSWHADKSMQEHWQRLAKNWNKWTKFGVFTQNDDIDLSPNKVMCKP